MGRRKKTDNEKTRRLTISISGDTYNGLENYANSNSLSISGATGHMIREFTGLDKPTKGKSLCLLVAQLGEIISSLEDKFRDKGLALSELPAIGQLYELKPRVEQIYGGAEKVKGYLNGLQEYVCLEESIQVPKENNPLVNP